jgi:hypothetical protein
MEKTQILKVIVGSQAHGLAGPNSDFDYRGVFVVPTKDILKIGGNINHTSWIEGKEDDTSWEIGKFLLMATKCNPTVLETFLAERMDLIPFAELGPGNLNLSKELQDLFPHVWNSQGVKDAFIGYGFNQRKKFFDNKDKRAPKYATAYLRVLYNAWELLSTGTFSVNLSKAPIFDLLKRFKAGNYEMGEVIQHCMDWETRVLQAYNINPNKKTNLEPVNEFLLKVRKQFWN